MEFFRAAKCTSQISTHPYSQAQAMLVAMTERMAHCNNVMQELMSWAFFPACCEAKWRAYMDAICIEGFWEKCVFALVATIDLHYKMNCVCLCVCTHAVSK